MGPGGAAPSDSSVKVRFGFTCRGVTDLPLERFGSLVADLERHGFDSIWLPDVMLSGAFDPLVGLSYAAARTERLKIGTHLIVPGRNPVRLARELATLDRLSDGRLLLIAVLGQPDEAEVMAQHVVKADRGALMDEMVPLLRRLWTGELVDHDGAEFRLRDARVVPTPVQDPLEVWMGGMLPGALRRAGRLADGWIPGLVTVAEAAAARARVQEAAAESGRVIDPEHFGANLSYRRGSLPDATRDQLRRRRADLDPDAMVPDGPEALRARIDEWVDAGFSKFLLRPAVPPDDWSAELGRLADDVLDRW